MERVETQLSLAVFAAEQKIAASPHTPRDLLLSAAGLMIGLLAAQPRETLPAPALMRAGAANVAISLSLAASALGLHEAWDDAQRQNLRMSLWAGMAPLEVLACAHEELAHAITALTRSRTIAASLFIVRALARLEAAARNLGGDLFETIDQIMAARRAAAETRSAA